MAFPLVLPYRGAKDAGKDTPGCGRDAVLPLTPRCEWERSSGVRRTVCAASRSRPERCPNCDSGKGTSIPGVAGSPARGEGGPTSPPTRGRHPAGRWGNRRTSLIADTALPQVKTPGGRAGLRGRGHGGRQAEPRHIGDGGVRRDSSSVPGQLRPAETVGDEPRELFGRGTVEAIRSSTRIPPVGCSGGCRRPPSRLGGAHRGPELRGDLREKPHQALEAKHRRSRRTGGIESLGVRGRRSCTRRYRMTSWPRSSPSPSASFRLVTSGSASALKRRVAPSHPRGKKMP